MIGHVGNTPSLELLALNHLRIYLRLDPLCMLRTLAIALLPSRHRCALLPCYLPPSAFPHLNHCIGQLLGKLWFLTRHLFPSFAALSDRYGCAAPLGSRAPLLFSFACPTASSR